jgi:hypothetical protein
MSGKPKSHIFLSKVEQSQTNPWQKPQFFDTLRLRKKYISPISTLGKKLITIKECLGMQVTKGFFSTIKCVKKRTKPVLGPVVYVTYEAPKKS